MKIGILGVGNMGKTLPRKLSAAGHNVKVATLLLHGPHPQRAGGGREDAIAEAARLVVRRWFLSAEAKKFNRRTAQGGMEWEQSICKR